MSGCIIVVYGAVLPSKVSDAASDSLRRKLFRLLDQGILERPFSGNGEPPFYAGVQIASMQQYAYPEDGYEVHNFDATEAQKAEAEKAVADVPEEIRAKMTPIGRYVIPCP